jgi:glucose-1-phosphate cytidylyltransferase
MLTPVTIDRAQTPVVILCGGLGTRIREASESLPKPLVDIGGKPVLWHIMKIYSSFGFRKFVLCLGYKSDVVKAYFRNYRENVSDFTLHLAKDREPEFHAQTTGIEDWEITFVETGLLTQTGGRLRRVRQHLGDQPFLLTYGDGVGNIDLDALLAHHEATGALGTVTAIRPSGRYGELDIAGGMVTEFDEKPAATGAWVSGGFFVFERAFADDFLDDDPELPLEGPPLKSIAAEGRLAVHQHDGFWLGMDTYRDYLHLNELWDSGRAPWKVWE